MNNRIPVIGGILFTVAVVGACAPAPAQQAAPADAGVAYEIVDLDGNVVGELELREAPRGLLVHARVEGLSAGAHGFHLHETGRCEPPFESAGGHHAPEGRTHGFLSADGPHAGDLPNLFAADQQAAEAEAYAGGLTLEDLLDEDGSALVIHAGPDDYVTDPAGAAGNRVACAEIVE